VAGPLPLSSEIELDRILSELLGQEQGRASGRDAGDVPPELLELCETGRRLRASVQWVPLPAGRAAVRRALLATAEQVQASTAYGHAAWRRTVRWMAAMSAAVVLAGAFGLGAGATEIFGSPSGPLYGVRLQLEAARVALTPTAAGKADALIQATQARIADVHVTAVAGDIRGMQRAAAALDQGAGWLRTVTADLPAGDRKRVGAAVSTRAEKIASVAETAARLQVKGLLPAGTTVADMVMRGETDTGGPEGSNETTQHQSSSHGSASGQSATGQAGEPGAATIRYGSGSIPAGGRSGGSTAGPSTASDRSRNSGNGATVGGSSSAGGGDTRNTENHGAAEGGIGAGLGTDVQNGSGAGTGEDVGQPAGAGNQGSTGGQDASSGQDRANGQSNAGGQDNGGGNGGGHGSGNGEGKDHGKGSGK
jgi:hypothetical protein